MGHPETRVESSRRRKSVSQPLAQIIENFQRIKEERFNQRLDHGCISHHDERKARDQFDHHTHKVKFADGRIQLNHIISSPKGGFDDMSSRRRKSLPSSFHSFSPTSTVSSKEEQISNDNRSHYFPHQRRRHSVSHVMIEYSKHNLEELSKFHELKLEQMNSEYKKLNLEEKLSGTSTGTDTDTPKWMTGDDLHAFYNGWEREHLNFKRLSHRKRSTPHMYKYGLVSPRVRYDPL